MFTANLFSGHWNDSASHASMVKTLPRGNDTVVT